MDHFELKNGIVHAENVPLPQIAAEVGTPVYVYSRVTFVRHARVFRDGLSGLDNPHIAFAIKANPNLAVLRILAKEGYGADVVSSGELDRALAAGMKPEDIVFSGVGKSHDEMAHALTKEIGQFNVESEEEAEELSQVAVSLGKIANIALRVNPDVDAGTHEKISTGKADNKFGVPFHKAKEIYLRLSVLPGLNARGIALHIGSQLTSLDPLEAAFTKIGGLIADIRSAGAQLSVVDLGGGLGITYENNDNPPTPADYGAMVARVTKGWNVQLMFEPGRVIAGNAGILLTKVIRVKPGGGNVPFVIVDAAMNDLARPAMYEAYHECVAVAPNGEKMTSHIVGPVCETGDTFAMNRETDKLAAGDLAIFRTAGAYGATMASTYNSRALIPEVLVDEDRYAIVANRIEPETILAAEQVPDWLD